MRTVGVVMVSRFRGGQLAVGVNNLRRAARIDVERETSFEVAPACHATANDERPCYCVVLRHERVHRGIWDGNFELGGESFLRRHLKLSLAEQRLAKNARDGAARIGSLLMDRLLLTHEQRLKPANVQPAGL